MKAIKFSVAAAAALAFSTAAMADAPTVYGSIQHEVGSYYNATSDGNVMSNRSWGSKVGVKGSVDLGDGLTGLYQVEAGINAVKGDGATGSLDGQTGGGNGNNELSSRNTFVGVTGSFGTVLTGNHDTPYKLVARGAGMVAHGDGVDSITLEERRLKGAVAYVAPADALGGITLAVAYVPVADTDRTRENDGQHLSLGVLAPISDELKVALGYESAYAPAHDKTLDNMFVGANFKLDTLTVGAAYEMQTFDGDAQYNRIHVPVTFNMDGGLFVNATLQTTAYDKKAAGLSSTTHAGVVTQSQVADEATTIIAASVGKKFGKDGEVYVGAKNFKNLGGKGADGTDIAVGMRVNF